MPELPEVETVVRVLSPDVVGRTITGFKSTWERQLNIPPEVLAARVKNQQVKELWRRAKYIIFTLSDDYLLVHLKMTGRLYVAEPQQEFDVDRWLRQTFYMDNGRQLRFSDPRKFGRVLLVADLDTVTGQLGPEPLEDDFTLAIFQERLANRAGTIKPLLLNQSFVAGVGNIYADEALWKSRIDPRRKADTLKESEVAELYQAIRFVLQKGIDNQGASVRTYRKPDGTPGEQQDHFFVYDRQDQPCLSCQRPIHKIRVGQRGTHFCPHCQV